MVISPTEPDFLRSSRDVSMRTGSKTVPGSSRKLHPSVSNPNSDVFDHNAGCTRQEMI